MSMAYFHEVTSKYLVYWKFLSTERRFEADQVELGLTVLGFVREYSAWNAKSSSYHTVFQKFQEKKNRKKDDVFEIQFSDSQVIGHFLDIMSILID